MLGVALERAAVCSSNDGYLGATGIVELFQL
jgi:hypothetical protein